MLSTTGGLFGNIQDLANGIQRDVENQLNRAFRTFDVLEHEVIEDPEHTSYRMKVLTDDNGHVRVKTVKKDPGSNWQTHIEEYDRGNRAIGNQDKEKMAIEQDNNTTTSTTNTTPTNNNNTIATRRADENMILPSRNLFDGFFDNRMQSLANIIRNDVENQLNTSFKMFDVLEHEALKDPEHTSYRMRVMTDDNGHVRVKTVRKDPGSGWETHVEDYDRGNRAIEQGGGKNAAIGDNTNTNTNINNNTTTTNNTRMRDIPHNEMSNKSGNMNAEIVGEH